MDANEEAYIESKAFTGSMQDTVIRLIHTYPDIPDEVMTFMKLMEEMLKYAEAALEMPSTETYVRNLLDEVK